MNYNPRLIPFHFVRHFEGFARMLHQCLNDFVSRNNLAVSWDHENFVRDLTYVKTDLSNFSCIDRFIVSKNMIDCIINNFVVHDICNPSYHNLLLLTLSITCFDNIFNARNTCTRDSKRTFNLKKASHENIAEYKSHLDEKLISIKLSIVIITVMMYIVNLYNIVNIFVIYVVYY